ncbi:MAG: GTPase Era [Coriobacteriia bacterium]
MQPLETVKSGFVALVGRPNAGKSTLVNALVGSKVAIISDTPQTTRHRLRAIVDLEDAQIVFVDTPGLHKPQDALGEELNRSTMLALADIDVACLVIDGSAPIGPGDRWVAHRVAEAKGHKVLIITKADIVKARELEKQLAVARGLGTFDEVVVCSARKGFNIDGVIESVKRLLPDGPRYFPRDMPTDQSVEVMLAEFIRERILHLTHDEVPHAIGVAIEDMIRESDDLTHIEAVIFVERESQKGIIVGKGGEMIKKIGTDARVDLERLLGTRVYLDLRVKVKRDWRRDANQIKRFGYGEGR